MSPFEFAVLIMNLACELPDDRRGWEVIPEVKEGKALMEAVPFTEPAEGGGLTKHVKNFLDCMRSREKPNADISIGAHIARFAHLGNIALRTGRKLNWDHEKQMFIGDGQANEMVKASYRSPWKIPVL